MKRKKTLFICLIVLFICMGLSACSGQKNINSQSTDLGNSSEISIPDSEVGDDSELPSTEDTSSSEEDDDSESSSSIDSGSDSSNGDSSSIDEWIDIVFPRM